MFLREADERYRPGDRTIAEWASKCEFQVLGFELPSSNVLYAFDDIEDAIEDYERWKHGDSP